MTYKLPKSNRYLSFYFLRLFSASSRLLIFLQTVTKDIQIALLLISLLYSKIKENKILLVSYFISLLKICPHFHVQTIDTGSCFCTYHVLCRNLNLLFLLGILTLLFFTLIWLKPLTFKERKQKQNKII